MAKKEQQPVVSKEVVTLDFVLEKATKNTYRFMEADRPGQPKLIGTLYVQKHVFPEAPGNISVTINRK